jgi:hypothetical protein
MEQDDDPEKRIAELERMQGRASAGRPVEQPPAYPPAPQHGWQQAPNPYPPAPQPGWQQAPGWQQPQPWQPPVGQSGYGSPPAYGAGLPATSQPLQSGRSRGKKGILGIVIAGLVALAVIGSAGHTLYAYSVGTPTTATVSSCTSGKKSVCRGSWTINGTTQYGKVTGAGLGLDKGSVVDVRVHNGTAYTLRSVAVNLLLVAVGVPLVLFWWIRKRRRLE